jgi:hypothetical protein
MYRVHARFPINNSRRFQGLITYRAKLLDAEWLMKEGFLP